MARVEVVNSESAHADNEEKLRRKSEERMEKFQRALETTPVDFDISSEKDDKDTQLKNYRENAWSELRRILANSKATPEK